MMRICIFLAMLGLAMIVKSYQHLTVVRRYRRWYLNTLDENIVRWYITTVSDRTICDWRCIKYWDYPCNGVTFNPKDHSCRLNLYANSFVYEENSSYEISMLKRARAYRLRDGSDAANNVTNWTVENATKLCEKLDLQLMTYDELDTLREEEGYNSYECGYVVGGITTQPKSYVRYVNDTVGMLNCSLSSATAFCKDPLYA